MAESGVPVASNDTAITAARLVREGLIGLAPAARLFGTGRGGRGKHPSTLTRYCHEGVRLADGRVVRLECVRIGSQLMTTEAAVLRFIAAQQHSPGDDVAESVTPAQRGRRRAAATAKLDALLGT